MTQWAIEVEDLTVGYDERPVVWGATFRVPAGKITGIVGPNGAGKSTLLKAMVQILPFQRGQVRFWGQSFEQVYRRIAYVPQREEVDWSFPATVYDVVLMGRWVHRRLWQPIRKEDHWLVRQALESVEMWDYRHRPIRALSGGQQQRVFLARALAQQPDLFLLDEPFTGIDMTTENQLLELFRQLARQGKTIVAVHHNLFTAATHFDWVVLVNMHVIAYGPVSEVITPEHIRKAYGGFLPILSQLSQMTKK